jgi:hypothetical protein
LVRRLAVAAGKQKPTADPPAVGFWESRFFSTVYTL